MYLLTTNTIGLTIEGDSVKDYYTLNQAMELLGFQSANAFWQLARKHPETFVNLNPHTNRLKNPWYDRAALDKFAKTYHHVKPEKP